METKTLFTTGWEFLKTDLNATWEEMQAQSENFAPVELPHDWLIYNTKDLYEDSCGWYRRLFDWEGKNTGERIQLRFDGVYMDSTHCDKFPHRNTICCWEIDGAPVIQSDSLHE